MEMGFVFGNVEELPLKGVENEQVRVVIRPDKFVEVVVDTADGEKVFLVMEEDGGWVLAQELMKF